MLSVVSAVSVISAFFDQILTPIKITKQTTKKKRYRHLRRRDREIHVDSYPELKYPELYILQGGYRNFFEFFPVRTKHKTKTQKPSCILFFLTFPSPSLSLCFVGADWEK
jgi:hypothetical protein